MSKERGIVHFMLLITIVVVLIVVIILVFLGLRSSTALNLEPDQKTPYQNPFSQTRQYQNPFEAYQNPFDEIEK